MLRTKVYFHRQWHLQTLCTFHPFLSKYVPWIRVMNTVTLFASHLLSFATIQINSRVDATKLSDLRFS